MLAEPIAARICLYVDIIEEIGRTIFQQKFDKPRLFQEGGPVSLWRKSVCGFDENVAGSDRFQKIDSFHDLLVYEFHFLLCFIGSTSALAQLSVFYN